MISIGTHLCQRQIKSPFWGSIDNSLLEFGILALGVLIAGDYMTPGLMFQRKTSSGGVLNLEALIFGLLARFDQTTHCPRLMIYKHLTGPDGRRALLKVFIQILLRAELSSR